jgi:hypothetical protein
MPTMTRSEYWLMGMRQSYRRPVWAATRTTTRRRSNGAVYSATGYSHLEMTCPVPKVFGPIVVGPRK